MKKIKLSNLPVVPKDWVDRLNYRIRNDPSFRVNGVESLAKLIQAEENAFDGDVPVSIGLEDTSENRQERRKNHLYKCKR